jgi:hypothetical protein
METRVEILSVIFRALGFISACQNARVGGEQTRLVA